MHIPDAEYSSQVNDQVSSKRFAAAEITSCVLCLRARSYSRIYSFCRCRGVIRARSRLEVYDELSVVKCPQAPRGLQPRIPARSLLDWLSHGTSPTR